MKKKKQSKKPEIKSKKIKDNKTLILGILTLSAVLIIAAIIITKFMDKKIVSKETLIGSYALFEEIINEENLEEKIVVKATFNKDNTATYESSNGYTIEMTKGTYTFEDGKITYTKEYYNMPNNEEEYKDELDKIITFNVYEGSKLKQEEKYYDKIIILERVD